MGDKGGGAGSDRRERQVILITEIDVEIPGLTVLLVDRPCGCTESVHVDNMVSHPVMMSTWTGAMLDLLHCPVCEDDHTSLSLHHRGAKR